MVEEKEYDLKKSIEGLGVLVPIIKNKRTGHTVDGRHREQLGFKTPIYEIDIPEELEPIARLAINNVRRNADKDEEEWRDTLSKFVGIEGKKPQELADLTGVNISTIYRHLPQEFKDQKKVEAGKIGGEVSGALKREQTVKIPDTSRLNVALGRDATKPVNLVECERCHVHSGTCKPWHGHQLCEGCFKKAEFNPEAYHSYFRFLERARNHQVPPKLLPPKPTETWEQRKAVMQPQKSKIELKIVEGLRLKGYNVTTDMPIVVKEIVTEPDFNIELENGKIVHGYIDGVVHEGKRRDKDEDLRELLRKAEPGCLVVAVDVKGDSEGEVSAKIREIEEFLRW